MQGCTHRKPQYTAIVPNSPNICPYKDELVDEIVARLEEEERARAKEATHPE